MTPEEYQVAYEKAIDKQQMAYANASHDLLAFMRDLTKDQKVAFRSILVGIVTSENPASAAQYYSGLVTAWLDTMHGICPACRVSHNDELEAMMNEGTT